MNTINTLFFKKWPILVDVFKHCKCAQVFICFYLKEFKIFLIKNFDMILYFGVI